MNPRTLFSKFHCLSYVSCFVLAFMLVQPQITQEPQAKDSKLADRVVQLEQRVDQLEKIVFSNAKLSLAQAERRLADTKTELEHSRALFAKGFINDIQLRQDEFAVDQAIQELRLAKADQRQQQLVGEMDVLEAKQRLVDAEYRLEQTEKLAIRGYASASQLRRDKTEVEIAQRALENAKLKLEAAKELDSLKKNEK